MTVIIAIISSSMIIRWRTLVLIIIALSVPIMTVRTSFSSNIGLLRRNEGANDRVSKWINGTRRRTSSMVAMYSVALSIFVELYEDSNSITYLTSIGTLTPISSGSHLKMIMILSTTITWAISIFSFVSGCRS